MKYNKIDSICVLSPPTLRLTFSCTNTFSLWALLLTAANWDLRCFIIADISVSALRTLLLILMRDERIEEEWRSRVTRYGNREKQERGIETGAKGTKVKGTWDGVNGKKGGLKSTWDGSQGAGIEGKSDAQCTVLTYNSARFRFQSFFQFFYFAFSLSSTTGVSLSLWDISDIK